MSRSQFLPAPGVDEPGLAVTTLIDVSFLLLIYFLVTSTLHKREADLGISLPAIFTQDPVGVCEPFEIRIDALGTISVTDEVLDSDPSAHTLPNLLDRLRTYKRAAMLTGNKTLIVVDASDAARSQRLVDVLNAVATVGADTVTLKGFTD